MPSIYPKKGIEHSIAGVILAAGDSKRLGFPKQLLVFNDKTFIENIVEAALLAGLDPIVVVLGNEYERIARILETIGDQIRIVKNEDWQKGQSTSLRVAIHSVKNSEAAIFLLVDQPQIPAKLVKQIKMRFLETKAPVIAAWTAGRRGNPVLFSKETFSELAKIEGDQGGRPLFNKYAIEKVEWPDERILIDVDTTGDYERLKEAYA